MQDITRTLAIFVAAFTILELMYIMYPNFPKFPWDVNLEKIGVRMVIPLISAIFISVFLSGFAHFLIR